MVSGKTVLVIEESAMVRLEIKRALEEFGVKVLELNNAEDFFGSPWQFQDVDLMVLDISLPGMDGLEALQKIHSDKVWAYLPVIMLSGRTDLVTVKKALEAGAVNFIRKPFTKGELIERAELILGPLIPREAMQPGNASLEDIVRQNLKLAKRAGSPVALLELKVPDELRRASRLKDLTSMRDQIRETLRETDLVQLSPERHLVVILPFTGIENAKNVAVKLLKDIGPVGDEQALGFTAVVYPDDGPDEQVLLKVLREKKPG